MRSEIEATGYFKQVASALDLSAAEQATAWDMMTKANVGRDDPTSVLFCVLAKTGALTGAMSDDLKRNSADLLKAIRSGVSTDIEAGVKKALASMPADLNKMLTQSLEKGISDLASNVDMLVRKESSQRQTFRIGQIVLGVAFVVAMTFAGAYSLGRDQINAEAARWSALVDLPQGSKWLALATYNDLDRVLAQSCGPSDGRVVSGSKVCSLELFTSKPVSSSKGVDYVRLSLAEQANKLGWIGYLLTGAFGLLIGMIWSRRKRA